MKPSFEYIPTIGPKDKAHLKVTTLEGIDTRHGSKSTDRGRLYAAVTHPSNYRVSLYRDRSRSQLVAQGDTADLKTYFELDEQNKSGITGRAWLESYVADESGLVLIPTFAVDVDVCIDVEDCRHMPGYDASYGLAMVHAQAMRELMTSTLPSELPYLFGGSGLAAFVPTMADIELPDLTKLANPDQLRICQGSLVKATACEQSEHLEEFEAIARLARARFEKDVKKLAAINKKEEVAAEEFKANESTLSVGMWIRR